MKQCIFGNHLEYGDAFIEKVPEGVVICYPCARKHKDDTIYGGDKGGWAIGNYGKGYFRGLADMRTENPNFFIPKDGPGK